MWQIWLSLYRQTASGTEFGEFFVQVRAPVADCGSLKKITTINERREVKNSG